MKKIIAIALVLVLTVCALAGCRSNQPQTTTVPTTTAAPTTKPIPAPTTAPTTQPTTAATTMPTTASTDMTGPDMGDMIPGTDDTIDPTNGANQSTEPRSRFRN